MGSQEEPKGPRYTEEVRFRATPAQKRIGLDLANTMGVSESDAWRWMAMICQVLFSPTTTLSDMLMGNLTTLMEKARAGGDENGED